MEVVTPNTVKELVKIPHFSKLNIFTLEDIPESFDIQTFYEYIKGNKKTEISLGFDNEYSDDYLVLLQTIVYEIHATENPNPIVHPFTMTQSTKKCEGTIFASRALFLKKSDS
uniref:Uncharacterized protein n=1 Tax=Panagrolaimus davidi TaxID=227884 RepID=A0A914P9S9_9BILA